MRCSWLAALMMTAACGAPPPPLPIAPAPTAVASAPTAPQKATPSPAEVEIAAAIAVVESLRATDFAGALRLLGEKAKASLSEDALRESWQKISGVAGACRGIEKVATTMGPGFTVVSVRCKTDAAAFEVRVLFDGARPGGGAPLATGIVIGHVWDLPAYADASKFREEGTVVGAGKWSLPAALTIPVGSGPFPAVVLVHGAGPGDRDETVGGTKVFRDIAAGLASRGVAVLRFDKRSTAHPEDVAKDTTFTFHDDTIDDARLAIAMLRKLTTIDKTKVFVFGHGEGGRLAPELAKEDPTLAGLVIAAASVKTAAGLPPSYARSLRKYRAEDALRKTKMPILIVAGDRDSESNAADFRTWKNAVKSSPRADTKLLPGLNHLFVSGTGIDDNGKPANVAPELIGAIAEFVAR